MMLLPVSSTPEYHSPRIIPLLPTEADAVAINNKKKKVGVTRPIKLVRDFFFFFFREYK